MHKVSDKSVPDNCFFFKFVFIMYDIVLLQNYKLKYFSREKELETDNNK